MKIAHRLYLNVFLIALAFCLMLCVAGVSAEKTVSGDITAFTAASLTGASEELNEAFTGINPDAKVIFNLAGTQDLKTQVENGAKSDVFISASAKYTKELKDKGFFVNETVKDLCTNWIIVITPKENPGEISELADLAKDGIKIAMGTEDVPVGMNTRKVIDKIANDTGFGQEWKDAVMKNTVTLETAEPSVVEKTKLGEVDAGFVYESSYMASADELNAVVIPESFNEIQKYSIAVLTEAPNADGATAFEEFMLNSTGGQAILEEYGFTPVA